VVRAEQPPPAVSGGTLLASADGSKLIAADPDRDAVYVVGLTPRMLLRRIELQPGDEPGRLVQDTSGVVHVALRGGRGIASFALDSDLPPRRTEVCDLPRGIAYDAAGNRLFIACADGALAQIDATTGLPIRAFRLGRDLRDVIVRGDRVFVTRFRSAEVLEVDPTLGTVLSAHKPEATSQIESTFVSDGPETCNSFSGHTEMRTVTQSPEVAWRTIDVPNAGLLMLHQRASDGEVRVTQGGYRGGSGCATGIVRGALSLGDDAKLTSEMPLSGLFVDVAVDSTNSLVAVANTGAIGLDGVSLHRLPSLPVAPPADFTSCEQTVGRVHLLGQVTAVAFVSAWVLAIQEREPAAISFYDTRTQAAPDRLDLQQPTRLDTGHALFHVTTDAGVACASCHVEGGDDGHVWNFEGIGPRRTQNIQGGILGSEPFHWNGDMQNFSQLVEEVFVGRMSAPLPNPGQESALSQWIDTQPLLHATPVDAAAAERGKALFESEAVGCTRCHTGPRLSTNESVDVGTGAWLQVPSLRAVSFRAPFMHDGCAKTLRDRFGACGGGDYHGKTSQLQATEIGDLVAYLESL
jgi:hypothetical protein